MTMRSVLIALALAASPAAAQQTAADLVAALGTESEAGRKAVAAGDYDAAALHFDAAREAARRLSLQGVLTRVSKVSPAFTAEDSRFVLATSSTLQFEDLLKDRSVVETRFINPEGKVVVVRAFGAEDDMKDFKFIADDPAMLKMAALEKAAMPGGPALKRKTPDGGLSVLMMSEKDHALIEVSGASEADVMAVVEAMEGGK